MGRAVRNRVAGPGFAIRRRVGSPAVDCRVAPLLAVRELLGHVRQPASFASVVRVRTDPLHDRALGRGQPDGVRLEESLVVGTVRNRERQDTSRLGSPVPGSARRRSVAG